MPRVNVYFPDKDLIRLKKHCVQQYTGAKAQSLVIRLALKEYLDKLEGKYERERKQ